MTSPNPAEKSPANPYVGPRPFEHTEEDRSHFFGRAQETQEIVSLIFGHPLTLVYAQSGAGKTSLFNASIIPTLEDEHFDVLPPTRVRGVMPENIASEKVTNLYIFNALLNLEPDADPQNLLTASLKDYLTARPRSLKEDGQPVPRAIIFDQFEELFTYSPEKWQEQREGFFLQVTEALDADPLLRIVFIIREDFLAQLDPYARNLSERLRARYRLERLQEAAALRAIKDPLTSTTRSFAPGVAENLVKELLTTRTVDAVGKMTEIVGQYVEPVQLQVVCLTLWSSLPADCTVITQEHLQNFNVNIALSDFYETAIRSAVQTTGVDEKVLRNWFGKTLITPMETRSTVYRGDQYTGDIPNTVVDILESRHLIRAEYRAGVRWYELTHDRFIEAIVASNKDWYAKKRGASGNPLTEPARDWQRLGRDEGILLRGAYLDEMLGWAQTHPTELDELERAYLEASQVHYQKDLKAKARTARILSGLTIGLATALIIAAFAAITASSERNDAVLARGAAEAAAAEALRAEATARASERDARDAEFKAKVAEEEARSGQFAIQSLTSLKTDPQLSLLLAIEANNVRRTFQAEDALRQAIDASRARAILNHQSRVNALAFSNDGKYLVTGDSSGSLSLWEVATGTRLRAWAWEVNERLRSVDLIAFDPQGNTFVTGSADGSLSLWNMNSVLRRDELVYFRILGPLNSITSLAFSRDGDLLAAGSAEGVSAVWKVEDSEPLAVLEGHTGQVTALAFSPTGDRVATAGLDATARLWETETGLELVAFSGHTSSINAVAFSLDGQVIATASADNSVRLWRATDGERLAVLLGHSAGVAGVLFDPSGQYLAAVSADGTARLWNVTTAIETGGGGAEVATLQGHGDRINTATFSPNGELLATASADGTARLWKVPGGELQAVLQGHTSSVNLVVFDPNGNLLATASSDNTVRLWGVANEEAQITFSGPEDLVYDLAVNAKGSLLVTMGEDGTFMWDLEEALSPDGGSSIGTLVDGPGLFGVDSSPNGNLMAFGSFDEAFASSVVKIWDASKPIEEAEVASLELPGQIVVNVAFAPQGDLLGFSAIDENFQVNQLYLWNFSKASEEDIIDISNLGVGEELITYGMAFNPDGSLLAASLTNEGGETGSIYLWNVKDLVASSGDSEPVIIRGQGGPILVAFSPDGKTLASGGFDGTVRLWNVAAAVQNGGKEAEIAVLHGHEGFAVGLAFSPDGKWLASSSENGDIRIWDVPQAVKNNGRNAEVSILRGQGDEVFGVAFSPDGDLLFSAGDNGSVKVWPLNLNDLITLACSRATRNFTQTEWDTYFGQDEEYRPTCGNLPYHPTALEAMIEQGKNLARQDHVEEARSIWMKVVELDPKMELNPDALLAEIFVEKGREYANANDPDKALDLLRQAMELDPTLDLEPEKIVAEILVEVGMQYASAGEADRALETLIQAAKLDPTLDLEPEKIVAEILVEVGERFASAGEPDQALTALRRAKELDPTLDLEPEVIVARKLADAGEQYAAAGDVDKALKALRRAAELDPALRLDPEGLVAEALIELGTDYADEGNFDRALETWSQGVELDPKLGTTNPGLLLQAYFGICWFGSLTDSAPRVLPVCQQAVELAEKDDFSYIGIIRDARGLARAMTGDLDGAIEDFSFYLEWAEKNLEPQEKIAQRLEWIAMLKKGINPFENNPKLLEELRESP